MELRIENGRGKWRTVKTKRDMFYRALWGAWNAAVEINRKLDPDRTQEMFYPVVMAGSIQPQRMYVTRINAGHAYLVDRPVDPGYGAWVSVQALRPAGDKPKREVSPERREQLAKNLEKARAARGKKE